MSSDENVARASIDRDLGLDTVISRRDFLNGTAVALGSGLTMSLPGRAWGMQESGRSYNTAFNGPPGVGDYRFDNGNTWEVLSRAHAIRDRAYTASEIDEAPPTDDEFSLVIVGGGPAGLGAAYYFNRLAAGRRSCLILDNHGIFGGEAKRNEFIVNGTHLYAPQGSNLLFTPRQPGDGLLYEELTDIGMPLEYEYAAATGISKPMSFDRTNYGFLWLADGSDSVGFFNHQSGAMVRNPWKRDLVDTAFSEEERSALLRWRYDTHLPEEKGDAALDPWLDSMSIHQYLTGHLGLHDVVSRYCDTVLGSAIGLGSETSSALIGKKIELPGFVAKKHARSRSSRDSDELVKLFEEHNVNGFPGGNAFVARYFLKHLLPDAISGDKTPGGVTTGSIDFGRLDQSGRATRLRLGATVLNVAHQHGERKGVRIVYERDGKLQAVRAKAVVMATGAWVTRNVVRDLPPAHLDALASFVHVPVLVANVALTNWRFLDSIGVTACRWFSGDFGFSCNIRAPIQFDGHTPPLDPNKPIVLTFYAPIIHRGLPASQQAVMGRTEVLSTPFREYERQIRLQMTKLFAAGGFDAARDIAAITLNRWGHAYVVPQPGFFFGPNGTGAPSDRIREPFGRIAFAHSELRGLQNFRGAVYEAKRAVEQVSDYVR